MLPDYLCQDITTNILTRVPLKTIGQCACVCKSWNSIITSPNFINSHIIKVTTSITTNNLLLVRYYYEKKENYSLHCATLPLPCQHNKCDLCKELDCPIRPSRHDYFRVVGSCHGVLCLSEDLSGYTDFIVLYNPSISKCVNLPTPPSSVFSDLGCSVTCSIGFGFDPQTEDYKVVRVVYLQQNESYKYMARTEIYELSTGSWRAITAKGLEYAIDEHALGAYLNGFVYWLGCNLDWNNGFGNLIVSFDVGAEVFGAIIVPDRVADPQYSQSIRVVVYGESLYLLDHTLSINDDGCCIWMLKENGAAMSWSKVFEIRAWAGLGRALGFRQNGEVLFITKGSYLVSCEPRTKKVRSVVYGTYIPYFVHTLYVDSYMESLVLLKGVNGALGKEETFPNTVDCKGLCVADGEVDFHLVAGNPTKKKKNRQCSSSSSTV